MSKCWKTLILILKNISLAVGTTQAAVNTEHIHHDFIVLRSIGEACLAFWCSISLTLFPPFETRTTSFCLFFLSTRLYSPFVREISFNCEWAHLIKLPSWVEPFVHRRSQQSCIIFTFFWFFSILCSFHEQSRINAPGASNNLMCNNRKSNKSWSKWGPHK